MWRVWLVLVCLVPVAVGEEIVCPTTVPVRQVATEIPDGWSAILAAAPIRLAAVTFFDGRPEEEASLVYDRLVPGRTNTRAHWTFQSSSHIWLACSYSGTTVVLSRPLPGVTHCTVTYKKESTVAGLPEVERVFCR